MKPTTIKCGILYRDVELRGSDIDKDKRTIKLSFSSETPVDRWFGKEILDHAKGSVDLARLNNAAPLLVGHSSEDQVGVIESARLEDKRGVAEVRFGQSPRAQEIFTDVMDGIRRNVSVGYRVNRMVLEEENKDGPDTYRATSWTPLELSIVSVPADPSVGVGRSDAGSEVEIPVTRKFPMEDEPKPVAPILPEHEDEDAASVQVVQEDARKQERERIAELTAIATRSMKYGPRRVQALLEKAVRENISIDEFRKLILELINNAQPLQQPELGPQKIGMEEKQLRRYSFVRAIMGAATNTFSGLEREVSDEYTRKYGRAPNSFWIPPDVLHWRVDGSMSQRDLTVGTATAGGNLVGTNLLAASFIEMLRNRMVVAAMGATVLDGLVGSVAIPRQTGGTTAYWTTEQGTTTESNATFDQVTMSPKGCSAIQDYSKQLLAQSTPAIDGLVRSDLAMVLALAQDLGALHGTGANNQPTGLINVTGIGDVEGGVNGATPSWSNVVDLETKVATGNADIGSLGYITNAKVRGVLKVTEKATGTAQFIWTGGQGVNGIGEMNGYRAAVTNQVSSSLEKGASGAVCSAVFFGNWADLVIGQWGGLDILVDPYTQAATRSIRVVASMFTDIAVRRAASFAAMKDALTA